MFLYNCVPASEKQVALHNYSLAIRTSSVFELILKWLKLLYAVTKETLGMAFEINHIVTFVEYFQNMY